MVKITYHFNISICIGVHCSMLLTLHNKKLKCNVIINQLMSYQFHIIYSLGTCMYACMHVCILYILVTLVELKLYF